MDEDQILHDEELWEDAYHEREQQRQQARKARIENGKRHAELRLKDLKGLGSLDRFLSVLNVEKAFSAKSPGTNPKPNLKLSSTGYWLPRWKKPNAEQMKTIGKKARSSWSSGECIP